jgi:hypothetical protein
MSVNYMAVLIIINGNLFPLKFRAVLQSQSRAIVSLKKIRSRPQGHRADVRADNRTIGQPDKSRIIL